VESLPERFFCGPCSSSTSRLLLWLTCITCTVQNPFSIHQPSHTCRSTTFLAVCDRQELILPSRRSDELGRLVTAWRGSRKCAQNSQTLIVGLCVTTNFVRGPLGTLTSYEVIRSRRERFVRLDKCLHNFIIIRLIGIY
jgi:hypothetical protein